MSLNIAKRKSEVEGTSTSNNAKRVRRSGEGAKQLFPKHCMICKHSGTIVRFANIKEDEDMLKIACDGKLLERAFMVHGKCYREYTGLPKDETVRCLKFHQKCKY